MGVSIGELLVLQGVTAREALLQLNRTALGFLFVVDPAGKLRGVLTDGDVRRAFLRGESMDSPLGRIMRKDCVSLPADSPAEVIQATLDEKIAFVPLLDAHGRPVDFSSRSRQRRFPISGPWLGGNEIKYVTECLDSGWVSSQGGFVGRFERMFAEFHGMPHALAVNSGTAALHLALLSLGIGKGDEVIVPDFTFAASASAVVHCGATPILVDVDPGTWTIDVASAERALTPRTRAIMAVHLYGHPCNMDSLLALAKSAKLSVVEDCAEAIGARFNGQKVGTFGDAACFSFFGNKTVTTGEGGMILFHDAKAFERAKILRDHGMSPHRRYWHLEIGFNHRLTNLQAAIGVAQMERVDELLARKRAIAQLYDKELSSVEGITRPPRASWAEPVCWLYTVRLASPITLGRETLIERLLANGVEARHVFHPLHGMPPFAGFGGGRTFPVADQLSSSCLSLPSAMTLSDQDVRSVAGTLIDVLGTHKLAAALG